jgi:hypothetical protein
VRTTLAILIAKNRSLLLFISFTFASLYCLYQAWAVAHTTLGSITGGGNIRDFTAFDYEDATFLLGDSIAEVAEKYQTYTIMWGSAAVATGFVAAIIAVSNDFFRRYSFTDSVLTDSVAFFRRDSVARSVAIMVSSWIACELIVYYLAMGITPVSIDNVDRVSSVHWNLNRMLWELRLYSYSFTTYAVLLGSALYFIRRDWRINVAIIVMASVGLLSIFIALFRFNPASLIGQYILSTCLFAATLYLMSVLCEWPNGTSSRLQWDRLLWPFMAFLGCKGVVVFIVNQNVPTSFSLNELRGWNTTVALYHLRQLTWPLPVFCGWLCLYLVSLQKPHPARRSVGLFLVLTGIMIVVNLAVSVCEHNWLTSTTSDHARFFISLFNNLPIVVLVATIMGNRLTSNNTLSPPT